MSYATFVSFEEMMKLSKKKEMDVDSFIQNCDKSNDFSFK